MILLPACTLALAPLLLPQDLAPGFSATDALYPGGASVRELSDGSFVTCNGSVIQRWDANGTLIALIGSFTTPSVTGAMVVDPTESFLLVGEQHNGEVLRVELDGTGQSTLAILPDNADAAFSSTNKAVISWRYCDEHCGTVLTEVNTATGAVSDLAALPYTPGPVSFLNDGDLIYGTFPVPQTALGQSDLVAIDGADLASPPAPAFQAYGNLVVIETESVPPTGNWNEYSDLAGFTGASYYRWDGPDHYSSPGNGVLTYEFEVTETANYKFRIHNRHDDPEPDKDNDCWVRVDGSPWYKVFSNEGSSTVKKWNWHSVTEETSSVKYDANYDLTAGRHVLEISGRSNGYMADRFVFYQPGVWHSLELTNPESPFAPFSENYTTVFAGGVTGPYELIHDKKSDTLFLAEYGKSLGHNAIHRVSANGTVTPLVDGLPSQLLHNLSFRPEPGSGAFLPYQPSGNGALGFVRFQDGVVKERRSIEPLRPEARVSGPGAATGTGMVSLTLEDGPPGGAAFFAYSPAPTLFPSEYVVPIGGLPLLHTAMNAATTSLLPTLVPLDATGDAAVDFFHGIGIPNVVAIQAILFNPDASVAGTSTTAIL